MVNLSCAAQLVAQPFSNGVSDMTNRNPAIKAFDAQIDALTATRAQYDASAIACADRDMAAHLREQAALFTGYIAQARADRAAINY
jgi:hypothetical protein